MKKWNFDSTCIYLGMLLYSSWISRYILELFFIVIYRITYQDFSASLTVSFRMLFRKIIPFILYFTSFHAFFIFCINGNWL